jgi:hypothetical protein
MKTKILILCLIVLGTFSANRLNAKEETRDVASFSEIALKVPATLYLKQGDQQSVKIEAKESTLEDLITEVKGRTLTIRFPNTNMFQRNFNPGKIDIYITVPDIDALTVSGSGDILAESIKSRIIELLVSGSGDISIDKLNSERITSSISGSGNIILNGGEVANELNVAISGSGDVKAKDFEATEVSVRISGSGNCSVTSNGSIKARIAGSGNVNYKGNPSIDSSVAGSGRVKEM